MKRIFPPRDTKPSPERFVGCGVKVQLLYQVGDKGERELHKIVKWRKDAMNE
jgi:hypothetical protein